MSFIVARYTLYSLVYITLFCAAGVPAGTYKSMLAYLVQCTQQPTEGSLLCITTLEEEVCVDIIQL